MPRHDTPGLRGSRALFGMETKLEQAVPSTSAGAFVNKSSARENVTITLPSPDGYPGSDDLEGSENPQNWPKKKKWEIILIVSAITFNQAMSATIFAPAVAAALDDLRAASSTNATLAINVYVIGLAVGPLLLSPLSERYGRMPIMHGTNLLFLLATVLCAASVNLPMLLVARFLAGAAIVSLGGGYVADLMEPQLRQRAMNVWTIGPVLAPIFGPILGGYISMNTSWRWTFGVLGITGAISTVATAFFLEETYAPRLRYLKASRLRKKAEGICSHPCSEEDQKSWQLMRTTMARPFYLAITSPTLLLVSLFLSIAYSYLYIMFTTFSQVFSETYGFTAGEVGLSYLGLGIGSLSGQYSLDLFMRRYLVSDSTEESGSEEEPLPERNLPILMAGGALLAIGITWYGWALEYRVHWIVPIFGTAVCGFAISLFFLGVQTYIVEVYTLYAASALAANTAIRCAFGLTVPLAAPHLYRRLGFGWGNTLLGFLAVAIIPAAYWMWRSSKRLRERPES